MSAAFHRPRRSLYWAALALLLLVLLTIPALYRHSPPPLPGPPTPTPPAPAPMASWPWPHAEREILHPGVTHWLDRSSPDGTVLDLFDFDMHANPHLRLELYDQDQDDTHPFDDFADCWMQGVGQVTRHLNRIGPGPVIVAWNGLFFNAVAVPGKPYYAGRHVTPVVIDGQVHCHVGQARWTFGVQYDRSGRPTFKTRLAPDTATLALEFTFAAGGAQCLIQDGRPLKLHPFPRTEAPTPRPIPCAPDEAGYIPDVDWIQTSRATMAWSRDGGHFYLLFAKAPGTEGGAVAALHGHGQAAGGWTVSDEQRFWLAKGVWGAVNSDGGDVAQLAYRLSDGRYVLQPPQGQGERAVFGPDFGHAPHGGTLLTFYVRDTTS